MRATRTVALSGLLGLGLSGAAMLGTGIASAAPAPTPVPKPICTPLTAPPATGPLAPVANVVNPIPLLGPLLGPVMGVVAPPVATPPLPPCGPDGKPLAIPSVPAASAAPADGAPSSEATSPGPSNVAPVSPPAPTAIAVAASSLPSFGHVPRYTYGDLTSVPAGGRGFAINVAPMPGAAPGFVPLADPSTVADPSTAAVAGLLPSTRTVSEANQAIALPSETNSSRVPMQAVLAALFLALTTAVLVRTWVLRHTNL